MIQKVYCNCHLPTYTFVIMIITANKLTTTTYQLIEVNIRKLYEWGFITQHGQQFDKKIYKCCLAVKIRRYVHMGQARCKLMVFQIQEHR